MAQKVLYREWRPRNFDEVVGQEHIVHALRQAVITGELAHAYLFVGTRGTGKTSLAKIFARAVNCLHPTPEGNPCNECEICRGCLDGSLLDVIEMDAASNNSVDNIRKITDEVLFLPALAKYKVYIIDEVHMLSVQAFNALLKTLEEPPAHVIFIMATTDPQRILPTILSRCQRYDFKRIPPALMEERLALIARENKIPIDEEGLRTIVSRSEGALRDAISLLDQSRSVFSGPIGREEILEMTGVVNDELLEEIVDALVHGDADQLLLAIDHLVMEGGDLQRFLLSLTSYFRDLLVCKTSRRPEKLLQLPRRTIEKMLDLAPRYGQVGLIRQIAHLTKLQGEMKQSPNPRITLEVGLIQMLDQMKVAERDAAEEASRAKARPAAPSRSETPMKAKALRADKAEQNPSFEPASAEAEAEDEDQDLPFEDLGGDAISPADERGGTAEADESRLFDEPDEPAEQEDPDEDDEDGGAEEQDEDSETENAAAFDEAMRDFKAQDKKKSEIDRLLESGGLLEEEEDGSRESSLDELGAELDMLDMQLDLRNLAAEGDEQRDSRARTEAEESPETEAPLPEPPGGDTDEEADGEAEDEFGDVFEDEDEADEDEDGEGLLFLDPGAEAEKGSAADKAEAKPGHLHAPAAQAELPEDFDPEKLWHEFIGRLTPTDPLLGILLNSYPYTYKDHLIVSEIPAEKRAIYDKINSKKNRLLLEQVFGEVRPSPILRFKLTLAGQEETEDGDQANVPEWVKKMKRAAGEMDVPLHEREDREE